MPRITKTLTPQIRKLPDRAKEMRIREKLSQRAVERGGGLPTGRVTRIEQGKGLDGLSADFLVRLARGIGVSVGELLGEPPLVIEVPAERFAQLRVSERAGEPKRLPGRVASTDSPNKR